MSALRERAAKTAQAAGLGVIWESIIATVLPVLIGWLTQKCNPQPGPTPTPDPETTKEQLEIALDERPRLTRLRVEQQCFRTAREESGRMSGKERKQLHEDARKAADQIIADALMADDETIAAVVAECC